MSFSKLEVLAPASRLSGLGLGLAAAMTLGLSSWALGQDCGAGDSASNEPCLVDGNTDTVNGGCNSVPEAFTEAAGINVSISGTVSTYNTDATDRRDTDWYLLSATDLAAADVDGNGIVRLTSTATAEMPVVLFIVAIGNPICSAVAVIGDTGFAGPDCVEGEPASALIEIADHPNGIVYYIAPGNPDGTAITVGFPCSLNQTDYLLSMQIEEPFEFCAPGNGSCSEDNGTPGCNDPECCNETCEVAPFCCTESWDFICVGLAQDLGCLPPSVCDNEGDTVLTQSDSPDVAPGSGVACAAAGFTTENSWARSYIMDADLSITCVGFGIETNTGGAEVEAAINVYLDTNGGNPGNPDTDLQLIGSATIIIDAGSPGFIIPGNFDPPIEVSAGQVIVVVLDTPNTQATDPPSGIWPGANGAGQTGASWILAAPCGLTSFVDLAAIGFPDSHLVNFIWGDSAGNPCPADFDGDGSVGTTDLLILLAAWGGGGPADLDGDGSVGTTDLLVLLAAWGPCP